MNLGFKFQADKEIFLKLKQLETEAREKLIDKAARNGAKVIEKAMKSNIASFKIKVRGTTYTDSDLRRAIGIVKRKTINGVYYVIGAKISKNEPGFLGVWIEFGTLAKRTEPLRRKRSKGAAAAAAKGLGMVKKPFARKAFESGKAQALAVMKKEIEKALLKIAK